MELSCSGFVDCTKVNGKYICDLSDSNYFFERFTVVLVRLQEPVMIQNINQVIKNLCFVYEIDGKEIQEMCPSPNLILRENMDNTEYWINCNIVRPAALTINRNNPEKSCQKIKLIFQSDFPIARIQLNEDLSHINNNRKKNLWSQWTHSFL